ncbi:MAG: hypothetical protein AVW06_03775 [Hadesarchaea archaeon DG-33-1]|nr:MAG: hypothetical protein AVW06_03775 [Hadesarchaea archaeon DG-33-1]
MELRKLQLVGRASFSVTLPPNWIKGNNLKPSDQITITQEEDGSLRLVPGITKEQEGSKTTIDADLCKKPHLLRRLIVGGYIRGCDLIEIVSKRGISQTHKSEIQDTVDRLLGLGIMEAASDHIKIQSLIDHSKFPIKPLLKRLCGLALSINKDALQALKEKDQPLAEDVVKRENEVKRIYWLSMRQLEAATYDKSLLKKIGLEAERDPTYYREATIKTMSAADYALDIAKNVLALGKKEASGGDLIKIIQLGKLTNEVFSDACKAFFRIDVALASSTMDAVYHFEKSKDELTKEVGPRVKNVQVVMCLMNIIKDLHAIAECGKRVAEITINKSITEKGRLP